MSIPGFSGLGEHSEANPYSCCHPSLFGMAPTLPRRHKTEISSHSHPALTASQSDPGLPRVHRRPLMDAGLNVQLSDVDEIVFGHDIDLSNAAVKDVRKSRHFNGAFGQTSRQRDAMLNDMQHKSKAAEAIAASDMRAILYAQPPAAAPPRRTSKQTPFEGAAGHRSSDRWRAGGVGSLLHDAGLHPQLSDVDSIVFGVDLDNSDTAVKDVRQSRRFSGAAGGTSRHIDSVMDRASKRIVGPEVWGGQAMMMRQDPRDPGKAARTILRPPTAAEDAGVLLKPPPQVVDRRPQPQQHRAWVPMSRMVGDFALHTPRFYPNAREMHASSGMMIPGGGGASGIASDADPGGAMAAQYQIHQMMKSRTSRHMLPF